MSVDELMNKGTTNPTIQNTTKYISVNQENIYRFMDNSYEGTGGFRNGLYLTPHSRELFYDTRRDLSFYENYIKPIIDAMVVPVFNKPMARKTNNGYVREFLKDCDDLGTSFQSFMEDTLTQCRLHGIIFVIVDNFPQEQQPKTMHDAIENRIFPYVYTKTAIDYVSAVLYKTGAIQSIMFFNERIKISIDGKERETDTYIRFNETTTEILYKYKDKEWKVFETYTHNLGFVPVIPVYSTKRKNKNTLLIDPPLYDLAKLNLAIFNKDSEIRELERAQGFSLLYLQSDATGNITIGANNVLFLPKDTTITPGFASPDAAVQANLVSYLKDLKESLFRIAEQHGVTGVQAKSGIAIQWDFYAHESVLKKTSKIAESLEYSIIEIFEKYLKQEINYGVNYPFSFQPNDKLEIVKIIDMYLMMDIPPKAKAMALEKITRLLFAEKTQEELDEIVQEIYDTAEDAAHANNIQDGEDEIVEDN